MDLWQMVLAEHANIAELCRQVLRATGSGPNSRASLFNELDAELERHIRAKESVLYPALMRDERTRRYLSELRQEQEEIRHDLDELAADPDKNSRDWAMDFKELLSRVELYFTLEENGVLTVARGVIAPPQAEALRHAYERERIAEIEARRWHMPVALMPSRYGLSTGAVLGALAGMAAVGTALLLWRSTQHATSSPLRPVRRQPEPPFPLRSRVDAGRLDRGAVSGRASARRAMVHDDASDIPGTPMEMEDAHETPRENWFSSANPPRAPSGLASGLQPGGLSPGGGPGASVGSIGTGGAQTENRDTGSLKRDGR